MDFDFDIFKICAFVEMNDFEVGKLVEISKRYKNSGKVQETIGKSLFTNKKYEMSFLWFYFLYRKTGVRKYLLVSNLVYNRLKIEKMFKKDKKVNLLRDDMGEVEIIDIFDFKTDFVTVEEDEVIIDGNECKITKNDQYKTVLHKLKQFYSENTNYDLINYLISKDNIRVVKGVKQFNFLIKKVQYNINVAVNDRIMKYLINLNVEMDIDHLFIIYL